MVPDLISVIIPIYKCEAYLDRCVRSVALQTYRNLEILLVDDGSLDRCRAICDEWAERDARIRVIHKENGGLSDARNASLEASSGTYIAFVDGDDSISPDMLQRLYDTLRKERADMSLCSFRYVGEDGSVLTQRKYESSIRDEVLKEKRRSERSFRRLHSHFLFLQAFRCKPCQILPCKALSSFLSPFFLLAPCVVDYSSLKSSLTQRI